MVFSSNWSIVATDYGNYVTNSRIVDSQYSYTEPYLFNFPGFNDNPEQKLTISRELLLNASINQDPLYKLEFHYVHLVTEL